MQDLVVYGAGGMAKEVSTLVQDINKVQPTYRHIAYVVDDVYFQKGMEIHGVPVLSRSWLLQHKDDVVCTCAIGYPKDRRNVQKDLVKEGVRFASLLHPTTRLGEGTTFGEGCVMALHCDVTVDCRLGDGIFLNGYVSIGHDSVLEDFVTCFTRSLVSGGVKIGEASCIGTMAFINERCKVGTEAVVAPGSIVFGNVKERTHVMGNPAKRINI